MLTGPSGGQLSSSLEGPQGTHCPPRGAGCWEQNRGNHSQKQGPCGESAQTLLPAVPTAGAKAGPAEGPRKEGRESWESGLGKRAESWVWEVERDLEGNPN